MSFDASTIEKFLRTIFIPHGCEYNKGKSQDEPLCLLTLARVKKGKAELMGNRCKKEVGKEFKKDDLIRFFDDWLEQYKKNKFIDKETYEKSKRVIDTLKSGFLK
ncbi:hypothetical protein GF352_02520 [archaeon]|nr:hypothetical protein [archaeon]